MDSTFTFVDGNGEALIILAEPTRWPSRGSHAFAEAAGLVFDGTQETPPLRHDGIRLEDSRWVELHYVNIALTISVVIYALGKFEILDFVPWVFVAIALDIFAAVALFSGRYQGYVPENDVEDRRSRKKKTDPRNQRARRKRKQRARRRG
ncbi:MAG: hypothetical protein AB1679_21600 [Actinomycetota bacterium]